MLYSVYISILYQGGAQNLSCVPSLLKPLCPGTAVTCTCVVNGNTSFTRWNFPNQTTCDDNVNYIELAQYCPDRDYKYTGMCGPYLSASNTGLVYCSTSLLNITANIAIDGLVIGCLDLSTTPPTLIRNMTLTLTIITGRYR